jgi:hypothetical protein
MARTAAQFKFREDFRAFLPAHGVPKAGANYVTWMNRAAARLGRRLGPADLPDERAVEGLIDELRAVDRQDPTGRFLKNSLDEGNQRSTFKKYAQMVQTNFRGLFKGVAPANPKPETKKLHHLTSGQLLAFAKKVAGKNFLTLSQSRPFVVDVVDDQVVFYPESGQPFWLEIDEYVRLFNQHNSLRPGEYPKKLWTNSYFVSLVDALLNGTKPVAPSSSAPSEDEMPEPPSPELEAKVLRFRLRKNLRPPAGHKSPRRIKVTSIQIVRDPAVKAWVLAVSEGKCSCCLQSAPFKDDDGLPFLEVHHVRQLKDGGPDSIDNAVALCPNCHRACHHSKFRQKLVAELYRRFPRLKQ